MMVDQITNTSSLTFLLFKSEVNIVTKKLRRLYAFLNKEEFVRVQG